MSLKVFALTWIGLVAGFSQTPFPPLTITRQNNGDLITLPNPNHVCNDDFCIGLTSGTGSLEKSDSKGCTCQCHSYLPAFREDLNICVDDIQETTLAPFVGGSTSQLIPFVFLPLKGQLIYPSKEIGFTGLETAVCAVSKAKFLTTRGWMDLRNPINSDVPFRLYRDEGKSFLQWDGEADLRLRLSGRMILVYFKCREVADVQNSTTKISSPSVAFRVVGTPMNNLNPYNISEVSFMSNAQTLSEDNGSLTVPEYVAIGICSVLLGLIYVASVFLYLHIRKRNRLRTSNKSKENQNQDPHSLAEEGIIKNNPLLGLSAHFQPPDSEEGTRSDEDGNSDILRQEERIIHQQLTSVVIHPQQTFSKTRTNQHDYTLQENSNIERLPEENVSIIETLEGREDRSDDLRTPNGTIRKKLYFNPAYFEPHLLVAPPPAALEFLQKIREVISIAKQKMEAKRFVPSLLGIPEEDYGLSVHSYDFNPPSRKGSIISLKRENSRRKSCSGCPGCQSNGSRPKFPELPVVTPCSNCLVVTQDAKQRNIRKWLEDIPVIKNSEAASENGSTASIKSPKRIRTPSNVHPTLPPARPITRSVSKKETRRVNVREKQSPTRSLSPDFGSSKRPMSPHLSSDKASESDCSGSETYNKTIRSRRRQSSKIKKPKMPPPLPPGGLKPSGGSVENIYDTVANENGNSVAGGKFGIARDSKIPTITKKNMKAVIEEFAVSNGINKRLGNFSMDYEADSLERPQKRETTPTEYTDASSSQPSPSLSSALPMDEEMTMRNAVFNKKTGNRTISKLPTGNSTSASDTENEYELIVLKKGNNLYKLPEILQKNKGYSLVSEVYVNNGYNYNSSPSSPSDSNSPTMDKRELKVCYGLENQPGKLMIEVEDCLDNYIPVNDSDSFEPDTLDRKPSKKYDRPTETYVDSLERPQQILLRTTGSFRKDNTINQTLNTFNRNFGSLREIYEAKTRGKTAENMFRIMSEEEKLLTLEERHSRRQRQTVQPDVIPPPPHDNTPLYDYPKPPRKILIADSLTNKPPLPPKNGKNRSANSKTSNKKPSSVGIPDRTVDLIQLKSKKCEINNNKPSFPDYDLHREPFILNPKQEVERTNLDSMRDNDKWTEDELNAKNKNLDKMANTEEMMTNSQKSSNVKRAWQRYVDSAGRGKTEDSGYLSTDSNESRAASASSRTSQNDRGSETDESLGDGHSESGGESIETHSVFFGRFRKADYLTISMDSGVDTDQKSRDTSFAVVDDVALQSSDSEHASYATVVPLESTSTNSSN
ncbi:uncharacterized protein LOC123308382 [Coccinella septempunctata]|uniref:uncharacterized protein LOC123308382 n=1 Tax=Coccinella septempunctata TaxID=41139 RepID=UPI001D08A0AA|nr:uncharacterized protein LOC123308382 [Coccinella septempunctata]